MPWLALFATCSFPYVQHAQNSEKINQAALKVFFFLAHYGGERGDEFPSIQKVMRYQFLQLQSVVPRSSAASANGDAAPGKAISFFLGLFFGSLSA